MSRRRRASGPGARRQAAAAGRHLRPFSLAPSAGGPGDREAGEAKGADGQAGRRQASRPASGRDSQGLATCQLSLPLRTVTHTHAAASAVVVEPSAQPSPAPAPPVATPPAPAPRPPAAKLHAFIAIAFALRALGPPQAALRRPRILDSLGPFRQFAATRISPKHDQETSVISWLADGPSGQDRLSAPCSALVSVSSAGPKKSPDD
ncbi:uncharacterized protein PSFLO_06004 [Pseudozyma flocculosa]|uniref:Uncharacterized protein n=1 Tax=Pseudozyma flocculosa TaxID=84751 RepID=A0A5C3F831_9BASI|nr:uncharacterized protein PSFLO_06004 [Pseudozyma flocculosa]